MNIYAGIGGNRTLWGDDHDITAVELDADIAAVYAKRFPSDRVVVDDAHEYLLKHISEYDFIWSSPPCITHSRLNHVNMMRVDRRDKRRYPCMTLWQQIILLTHYHKLGASWVVENVISYYHPLVEPTATIGRHRYWSNLPLRSKSMPHIDLQARGIKHLAKVHNIDLSILEGYGFNSYKKRQILRNIACPATGGAILDLALGKKQEQRHQLALDLGAEI